MDPEDVPTIGQILANYGIAEILGPVSYSLLRAELEERDNIMQTDALNYKIRKALDIIIAQV